MKLVNLLLDTILEGFFLHVYKIADNLKTALGRNRII